MNERNDLYVMLVYYRAAEPDDSRLVTPGPRVEAFYPAGGWVRVEPAPDVGIIEPPEVRSPTRER